MYASRGLVRDRARWLAAQAARAGLRLVTAGQVLLGLGRDLVIDASR
jgi:hypothetical protein